MWPLSLFHTSGISISNENKARQNNDNFSLFRLLFCSWIMLGLWSYAYAYAYAYDDPYVPGLTSFLGFTFCFALMLMLSCEPGFNQYIDTNLRNRKHFPCFQTVSIHRAQLQNVTYDVICLYNVYMHKRKRTFKQISTEI